MFVRFMFMCRDLSIFLPDSNFIQVWLKQGHASLQNYAEVFVYFFSFFSSTFWPGPSLRLEVASASKKGVQGRKCCGFTSFPGP